jgi:aspartate/methionine/tyrosine aminotransferase
MKYESEYLKWYVNLPKLKYDFRSSGISFFNYNLKLDNLNLNENFAFGNPKSIDLIARRYSVKSENIYISCDGASGQNLRILRCISENKQKNEVIVEYPTYEPILRLAQEYFFNVKRVFRDEKNNYKIDIDDLRKKASLNTGLLILTNPHAPSSEILSKKELIEIAEIARDYDFFILCDEIYGEFNRNIVPTIFSIDPERCITISSFNKAYGLGSIRLGIGISNESLVKKFYLDTINSIGNSSNIVQIIVYHLFNDCFDELEKHKNKWIHLRKKFEDWMDDNNIEYYKNKIGVSYWLRTNFDNTFNWINNKTIPILGLSPIPGGFFLMENDYKVPISNMIRVGLGNFNPDDNFFFEALEKLERAFNL